MRSRFLLGLAVAAAFVATSGCRDDVHVNSRTIHEGPRAGTLVDTPWNTGRSSPYEGVSGSTLDSASPPNAIGGGPAPAPSTTVGNPPTGANDEGSPNMSEEPLPAKPDASEQSAGTTTQPPPIVP